MHCHARYQISVAAPTIRPSGTNTGALVGFAAAMVCLLFAGLGAAVYVSTGAEEPQGPEPAHIVVAEPVVAQPEPPTPVEPDATPEPPKPPEVDDDVVDPVVAPPAVQKNPNKPDPSLRYRVDMDGAHFRGPSDAAVTIVLFTDFQCPFCKRINKTLAEVTDTYGDDVRIAYMHNPLAFHERALPAAKAVEAAAAQGKFWEMYGLLFQDRDSLARSDFDKYARQLDLNTRRFNATFDDPATARGIKSQQREALRLKARGTPSCFINGRFLPGAQPLEAFAKIIDEELKAAKSLTDEGTPRSKVGEALMKDALPGI